MQKNTVDYIRGRHSPEDDINASHAVRDEISGPLAESSRDYVSGPLSSAEGVEDMNSELPHLVKKTVKETTQIFVTPTPGEQVVSRKVFKCIPDDNTSCRPKLIEVKSEC